MNNLLRAATLLVLLLSAACGSTRLALVDDSYGFEHLDEQRGLHLASPRVVIDRQGATGGRRDYTLALELRVTNDRAEVWDVRAADFAVSVMPCGDEVCPNAEVRVGTSAASLIAVPPHTTATLMLPLLIRTTGDDLRHLERFPIEVKFCQGERLLLHKRLLLGQFDQGWQTLRFTTVLTSGLLAAFLL